MKKFLVVIILLTVLGSLGAQEMRVTNFNLNSEISLDMTLATYFSRDANRKVTSMDQVNILCEQGLNAALNPFEIIDSCLNAGTITMVKLHMEDENTVKFLESFPVEEFEYQLSGKAGADLAGKMNTSNVTIKDFKLVFTNTDFLLTGRITSAMNVKMKVTGYVEVERDTKRILFTIQKARASFVNIKKQILNSFRNSGQPNITVEGDTVIVQMIE